MGKLLDLIGSGIGIASEALAQNKAAKGNTQPTSSEATQPHHETPGESSRSAAPANDPNEPPPLYADLRHDHANAPNAGGEAFPVDSKEAHHFNEGGFEEDSISEEELDEEQWALDEAVRPPEYTQYTGEPGASKDAPKDANKLADVFLRNHPPPFPTMASANLPCPVILPQRRPRDKTRGFIRAYAPDLAACGIDQNTFLDWLENFHQASQSSPVFTVVNVAAKGAGMVPGPISMGASIGAQVLIGTASELQRRSRTNSYLDRMNTDFFGPRGLCCLIITYKPESSSTHASVNINQAISSSLFPPTATHQIFGKIQNSSGTTHGQFEMPAAAPLIFPALDQIADSTSAEGMKKQSSLKSSQSFVSNYMDRRAQARYTAENPDNSLAQGDQQFANRYSDPNSSVYSGGILAFASGGTVKGRRAGGKGPVRGLVDAGKDYIASKKEGSGSGTVESQQPEDDSNNLRGSRRAARHERKDQGRRKGLVRRALQKDVVYLMIVNTPSEGELQHARQAAANEKSG